ncbi:MAG: ribulokinase [Clostridia bacterium]|nr:ribulokinase [Clostridia bacterium]
MKKYSIGIDYGTLSARALLIDLETGKEIAESDFVYPHAVMTDADFTGIRLLKTDAFQNPQDYLDAFSNTVKSVLKQSEITPEQVVGVGIDFTSCTVLPTKADGTPLCFLEPFKNEPQSYVKLWKHHSAESEAEAITEAAQQLGEAWLESYGGKVSSEWLFPKLLETLHKSPAVFNECDCFLEAADWLVWQLTGEEVRSSCMAGYKALWSKEMGYPSSAFWSKVDAGFGDIIGTKISEKVLPTGTKAGTINRRGAEFSGLCVGTPIAVPIIDAHSALPAAGIVDSGRLMIIAGTSSCHIVMSREDKEVKGICGRVQDGIIPGLVAYEAGQACVGDSFDWFVKNCVPASYTEEAKIKGQNIFDYITQKAEKLSVGESGILALDWWNGNRTPYANYDLTGTIIGLNVRTKPEEIFRAIIESTAFGTKAIIDLYNQNGVTISEIQAAGGISQKNAFMMQVYADVLGCPVKIAASTQAGAKGSAIFASVAGGYFDNVFDAALVIADKSVKTYYPNEENHKKYQLLYKEYRKTCEFFADNDIMKNIKLQ